MAALGWPGQVCYNTALEDSDLVHPPTPLQSLLRTVHLWRGWGGAVSGGSPGFISLQCLEFHSRFRLSTLPLAKSLLLSQVTPIWISFLRASGNSPPFPQAYYTAYWDQQTPSIWGSLVFTSAHCALENWLPLPAQLHWMDCEGLTGKDSHSAFLFPSGHSKAPVIQSLSG